MGCLPNGTAYDSDTITLGKQTTSSTVMTYSASFWISPIFTSLKVGLGMEWLTWPTESLEIIKSGFPSPRVTPKLIITYKNTTHVLAVPYSKLPSRLQYSEYSIHHFCKFPICNSLQIIPVILLRLLEISSFFCLGFFAFLLFPPFLFHQCHHCATTYGV